MGKVMSEETKYKLAHELGFGEKVEDGNWDDVTTVKLVPWFVKLLNAANKLWWKKLKLMEKLIKTQNK